MMNFLQFLQKLFNVAHPISAEITFLQPSLAWNSFEGICLAVYYVSILWCLFIRIVFVNKFFSYDHFKMWVKPLTFNCTTDGFDDIFRAIFLRNPLNFKSARKLFCFNITVGLLNPLG